MMDADVIVIGSGVGGGTVTRRLADLGLRVLLLERGQPIPREADNWNPGQAISARKYDTAEDWLDQEGRPLFPRGRYAVGGASKFFGAVMIRMRESDFMAVEHHDGLSPEWPFRYADLEPYYGQAEQLFEVHGDDGDDPTAPQRSSPYRHGAIEPEPFMAKVAATFEAQGLHPVPLPLAIDLHPGGNCIRCATCDGFPCRLGAKNDAETRCVEPALRTGNARLWTGARAVRLIVDRRGSRVVAVEVEHKGRIKRCTAKCFVLAAGAVNSTLLLLRSAFDAMPLGLANRSGVVGRHFMGHNFTVMMGISLRRNPTVFQKTLMINDYYHSAPHFRYPLGNIQTVGKVGPAMLRERVKRLPKFVGGMLARRSVDFILTTEDLPRPTNRVELRGGRVHLSVERSNLVAHRKLGDLMKEHLRTIGYPLTLGGMMPIHTSSAQCGTIKMGSDPTISAVDAFGRTFDHPNLFVADASTFVSSGAVNPSLTIAALALRVGDHLAASEFGINPAGSLT